MDFKMAKKVSKAKRVREENKIHSRKFLGKVLNAGLTSLFPINFFSIFFLLIVSGLFPGQVCSQNMSPASSYTVGPSPTPGSPPDAPTNFVIEPGDGAAHLSWDLMPNAKGYWIYISTDGKNFTQRFKGPWVRKEINLGGLENSKTYYYGIASVGFDGQKSQMVVQSVVPHKTTSTPKWALQMTPPPDESEDHPPVDKKEYVEWIHKNHLFKVIGTPSAYFTPLPIPDVPSNFKIEPGDGMAYLTWDETPRAIGYLLFVSEDGKKFERRFKKPVHGNGVLLSLLKNGKTYYYGVEAIGPYGDETKMIIQSVVPREGAVISKGAYKTQFK